MPMAESIQRNVLQAMQGAYKRSVMYEKLLQVQHGTDLNTPLQVCVVYVQTLPALNDLRSQFFHVAKRQLDHSS